jgi:hypothetical protein
VGDHVVEPGQHLVKEAAVVHQQEGDGVQRGDAIQLDQRHHLRKQQAG